MALKIAAGTFPLANETITTEDDTVEGRAAKNIKESQIISPSAVNMNGLAISTKSGKIKKVES